MADLVNPYANPYLPSFVNQRPRINEPTSINPQPMTLNYSGVAAYSQIHSVNGFEGARAYNLANGASEILAENDPNLARIYVVAKDANGQIFVQGFNLVPVEEPKPVTMDDLSSTMNQILERLNKLEGQKNDQSISGNAWKGSKQSSSSTVSATGGNSTSNSESSGSIRSGNAK